MACLQSGGIISSQQQVCTGKCQYNTSGGTYFPQNRCFWAVWQLSNSTPQHWNWGRGIWWFGHYYLPLIVDPLSVLYNANCATIKRYTLNHCSDWKVTLFFIAESQFKKVFFSDFYSSLSSYIATKWVVIQFQNILHVWYSRQNYQKNFNPRKITHS